MKGKKVLRFENKDLNKDDMLKVALGRSGTLRALALIINKLLLIGFNRELYDSVFKEII